MKVEWTDDRLQVFLGDEIEILRGVGDPKDGQIIATAIRNKTRGVFSTSVEGLLRTRKPQNYIPPIHGYVKKMEISKGTTKLELTEKPP